MVTFVGSAVCDDRLKEVLNDPSLSAFRFAI